MTEAVSVALAAAEARIDKLTQTVLHVAGELWVLRDRQAALEQLLADADIVSSTAIETYRPSDGAVETLAHEREAFVTTLLGYLAPEV